MTITRRSILFVLTLATLGAGEAAPPAAPAVTSEPVCEAFLTDAPEPWYLSGTKAAAYAKATAHEPLFTDKQIWTDDSRAARYAKQVWPTVRLLVWAKPGAGAKDGWDAKHWLENGKPAQNGIDPDTDLVFPDHDGNDYFVSLTDGRKYQSAAFRHLTIGRKATVIGHFATRGNLWAKAGGHFCYMDQSIGDGNCFLRDDNISGGWNARGRELVDHYFLRKAKEASLEYIGCFRAADNWQIESGLMVVAPQTEVGLGNRTPPVIRKDAALAIMSAAYLSRRSNCDWGTDLTVEGRLLAGLPERPLTAQARLGIGWKSKGEFLGTKGGGRSPGPNDYGMYVAPGGTIQVHSSNPAKFQLVINCAKRDNDWGQIEIISRGHPLHGEPLIAKLRELPRLTDMVIDGEVAWAGILLDDFKVGGIRVKTLPNLKAKSAGPVFGSGNAGKPESLFVLAK